MQVIAEADLIATVHLDRRDVNPRRNGAASERGWLGPNDERHGLMLGTEKKDGSILSIWLVYGIAILIIILVQSYNQFHGTNSNVGAIRMVSNDNR